MISRWASLETLRGSCSSHPIKIIRAIENVIVKSAEVLLERACNRWRARLTERDTVVINGDVRGVIWAYHGLQNNLREKRSINSVKPLYLLYSILSQSYLCVTHTHSRTHAPYTHTPRVYTHITSAHTHHAHTPYTHTHTHHTCIHTHYKRAHTPQARTHYTRTSARTAHSYTHRASQRREFNFCMDFHTTTNLHSS